MALYYITGIAGSGKSTILEELQRRGYEAYDVDLAGPVTAKWTNNVTGFVHPKSSVKAAARTPQFLSEHSWNVPRPEVAALAARAADQTIFMGGAIANEAELRDLFAGVFALQISDETLRNRLTSRTGNDWGKAAHELAISLELNRQLARKYQDNGYTMLDAGRPVLTVTEQLLQGVNKE